MQLAPTHSDSREDLEPKAGRWTFLSATKACQTDGGTRSYNSPKGVLRYFSKGLLCSDVGKQSLEFQFCSTLNQKNHFKRCQIPLSEIWLILRKSWGRVMLRSAHHLQRLKWVSNSCLVSYKSILTPLTISLFVTTEILSERPTQSIQWFILTHCKITKEHENMF